MVLFVLIYLMVLLTLYFEAQTVRETFIYFSIQYLIYFLLIINFHPLRNDKKNDNDELV